MVIHRRRNERHRAVVHAPARPPARPLLSVSYHHTYILRSFFPTRPIPSPSHPSIPSASTLPCRSTHSCDAAVRAQHGDGSIEEAATSSRSDISFDFDMLPRQFYLHAQLRLPSLYFRASRVYSRLRLFVDWNSSGSSMRARRLGRFKLSWEGFVASLVREWKTLNVLSALLLSAILTVFQIQNAENDPLTRTAALSSLVSALMSLSFGAVYIVCFDNMRIMYHASRWAEEAQKIETVILWNVWVLLAFPGVCVLAFIAAIMSTRGTFRAGGTRPADRYHVPRRPGWASSTSYSSYARLGIMVRSGAMRALCRYLRDN
ncbi:hypothetical protein V8E53_000008 [Lactarius tabidus]